MGTDENKMDRETNKKSGCIIIFYELAVMDKYGNKLV